MGATPVSQFLRSLCHNSRWSYAVFWKLHYENQMLLTWEDGCYDHPKPRGSMEIIPDDICFNGDNKIDSSCWGSTVHDGHSGDNPVGQAVACLEGVQCRWGEGVIGEAAYTGNHRWLLFENISAGEFESEVVPKFPYEWLLQFAAGIKTIVLIPVIPYGVLQVGALEKVTEDQTLVAFIKEQFNAYLNGMDSLPVNRMEFRAWTSSFLMPTVMDNSDEVPATSNFYGVKSTNNMSTTNQMMPVCLLEDACHISGKEEPDILNSTKENEINSQSMGLIQILKQHDQSLNDIESEVMEGGMVRFSSLQDELQARSGSDNYNVGIFGEHASVPMNSCSDGDMTGRSFVEKDVDNWAHNNLHTFFSFPMDCELHKALGPGLPEQTNEILWDPSLAGEDASYISSQIFSRDLIHGVEPPNCGSSGWLAKRDDAEHLLEAVVTGMYGCWNDSLSNKPNDVMLSVTSSGQFAACTKEESPSGEVTFVEEKRVPWSSKTVAFGAKSRNVVAKSRPAASFESTISTVIEEQHQKKGYGYLQTGKGSKLSNGGKRRAKPGENHKPRPRDRQLIQDRVKELRELVPNGSKCSIDGLLDKTINHMLFLRSVSNQADKLKQWVHQEVTGWKNVKSSGTNRQNGTSWAFELGSDFQVCPIVVEDLEYPGQMLIEMLCVDHGLFLEIAEVIRRFELTIMKGVMESRADNTWAHFIVEASRGFHRLDIFWPLMQLLQRNQSPISSKI
ncbi:transcription factor LHW-like [Actinidia eriantha]|uniref:transcription factor LHW-like n=1 Tax=Actinidia eriantha TaxID=165200 RepID=UPI00258521FA|nr:transcription factor LHW-like [Actinidia eriantha]